MRGKFSLLYVDGHLDEPKCKFFMINSSTNAGCVLTYFCGEWKKNQLYVRSSFKIQNRYKSLADLQ